jgi:hypothetical protein
MTHKFIKKINLLRHLRTCILLPAQNPFLLVWFEKEIEKRVEDIWRFSPSQGFLLHEQIVLTLELQLRSFLPELVIHECSPVPFPTMEMIAALESLGMHLLPTGQLNRVYATVTFWPWRDGCTSCALKTNCTSVSRTRNQAFSSLIID